MKLPTLSRRFWIACSTLAVIGALFAYYLMVYVAGREEKLREEKYRALARYGENMIHTRKDYHNGILKNWEKGRERYLAVLDSIKKKQPKEAEKKTETSKRTRTLDRLYRSKKDKSCQSCYDVYTLAEKIDSLQNIQISSEGPVRLPAISRADLEKKLNDIVKKDFAHVQYDGYKGERQLDSLLHDHFDRIYFRFGGNSNNKRFGLFSIATKDFVYSPNQFDEFLIIKKYDESQHGHDGEHVVSANESYQTFSNRVDLHEIDSFLVVEKGLLTSRFGEIKLADTKYKLFVHSIEFSPGENWILCGLMKVENFNGQVRSVDPFVITTAILMVLFLLIAMPILKIVLMNSFERLTKANVWFAGFSVVCGSATFLLIIWSESDNLQSQERINSELVGFSSAVKHNFENELRDIYNQLVVADKVLSDTLIAYREEHNNTKKKQYEDSLQNANKDVTTGNPVSIPPFLPFTIVQGSLIKKSGDCYQGDDVGKPSGQEEEVISRTCQASFHYPFFNFLIWIDSFGKPLISLSNKDIPIEYSMPELKERKYFSWAMNDSLWYLPNSKPEEQKLFTLQSIQSWADNETEAGIAIRMADVPRRSEKVLMISTRLHSIMNPLVQPGYGFCILDEKGEVWFHSSPGKNHQQNFIDEVNQKALVRAAVEGRMSTSFDAEYEGNRCQLHIEPISNIPLYLAVFHDNEYQRAPAVLTLYFTFAMVLIFFLFQGIQLLILFFCERRSSLARSCQSEYFLQVLRPSKDNTALYQYNSVVMAFVLIICIMLYAWGEIAAMVVFISLPILLMAFHQAMFQRGKMGPRQWLFLALSLLLFLLIDVLSFRYLEPDHRWTAAISQLVLVLLFALAYAYKKTNLLPSVFPKKDVQRKDANKPPISDKANTAPDKTALFSKVTQWLGQYPRVYYTNLTIWLIIISLLPVSFFYKFTRCEEWLRWTRYEQLEASRSEFVRLKVLDEKVAFLNDDPLQRKQIEQMGSYLQYRDTHYEKDKRNNMPASEATAALEELTFSAWPRLPDPFGISSETVPKAASDKKWFYDISAGNEGIGFTPDFRRVAGPNSRDIQHVATIERFNPFAGPYGLWFFLLIIVCFCLVVRTILFCTKYIFGINFIPQNFSMTAGELQQKIKIARRAVVIGLPGSDKTAMVTSVLTQTQTVDFQSEEGMVGPKLDTLPCIIHHFEYAVNDHAFNQKKLACLKELLRTPNRPIIILSAMHPCVMTDVYRKWISDMNGADDKEKDDEKGKSLLQEYKAAARNWKDLLGEFEVYHKSIRPETYTQMSTEAITEELNACYHLKTLTRNPEFQQTMDCNDDFIFRVEETAEPYYQALWSALSRSEKLFLMDLAQDGFVNLKCRATLRTLMQKGIVVERESALVVMNDSLKHFITGQFKEDDEIEVAKQMEKKGAWYSIRIVLVLVLGAIVIFIALAQEELFKNLNAFIVALSGALAFLTRFGGLFGSGSKAKE